MDLHNKSLILLFPNAYVKFQVVCGQLQEILGGFGWFWMVLGGFGWFRVVCCFSSYLPWRGEYELAFEFVNLLLKIKGGKTESLILLFL